MLNLSAFSGRWNRTKKIADLHVCFRVFLIFFKNLKFWWHFLEFWVSINFLWCHVRPHKKFGPDRFSRFYVYWIQMERQADKQSIDKKKIFSRDRLYWIFFRHFKMILNLWKSCFFLPLWLRMLFSEPG